MNDYEIIYDDDYGVVTAADMADLGSEIFILMDDEEEG